MDEIKKVRCSNCKQTVPIGTVCCDNKQQTLIIDEIEIKLVEEIPKTDRIWFIDELYAVSDKAEDGEGLSIEQIKERIKFYKTSKSVVAYSPDSFIQTALDKGLGIEYLERLMALKKDWDAQQARKAFDEAMRLFQSKCPIIKKTAKGGQVKATGQVAYHFAPIEDIVAQTRDLISECGFAYLIKAPQFTEKNVEVTVEVRHIMGHSEISSVTMPLLTKTGVMSDAQVVGGTNTFAKRYAFCNAFGIMTMDGDTDAVSTESRTTFLDRIKSWDYTDHILMKADAITIGEDFKKFLNDLPTDEDVETFKEILSRLNVEPAQIAGIRAKLWDDFQKLHKGVSKQWLEQLNKAKIIKQKEVHNE